MLQQFYIVFERKELDSFSIKHIQYNIKKRLQELKYVSYRRLDILLVDTEGEDGDIEWDDKKTANMKCYIDPLRFISTSKESIVEVYLAIFKGLRILWERNQWMADDLTEIYRNIEQDDFFSFINYGKVLVSPDKKHKAQFFCELYPQYADYYLLFFNSKGKVVQKVPFLHGHQDPDIYFSFFLNRAWRDNEYFLLSNNNKEIFNVFNVNESNFSLEYRPLNNSLEECKNYVAAFQANISSSERLKLLGFPSG